MSINVPGILSSPISRLPESMSSATDRLSAESLFLIEIPQDEREDQTPTHYISKNVSWSQLSSSLRSYLNISEIEARLQNTEDVFKVPSALVETTQKSPNQIYIISAIGENTRAQITEISVYNFKDAIIDITYNVEFPKVSAIKTPWVETNKVTSDTGSSGTLVASQLLLSRISLQIEDKNYLEWNQVVSELDNSETLVASQKLVNSVFNTAKNLYLKKSNVRTDIGDSEIFAASQKLVNDLSNTISRNFIDNSHIKTEIGDSKEYVASRALLKQISSYISANFLMKGSDSQYLRDPEGIATRLGNATDMGASQKLVTSLSGALSVLPTIQPGEIGDIYYLSSTMTCLRQKMAVTDVQVCENPDDLDEVLGNNFSFKKVYTQWTRNAYYANTEDFYNYNPYNVQGSNGSGIDTWNYIEAKNTVIQYTNADDYNFYVSPIGYTDYDFSARLYSKPSGDDDTIGLVAGYTLDSDAKPVMMWFERKQGAYYRARNDKYLNINHSKWVFCAAKQDTGYLTALQNWKLSGTAFKAPITKPPISDYYEQHPEYEDTPVSSLVSSWGTEGEGDWGKFDGGTIIKIRKRGNMISAWTTKFGNLSTARPGNNVPTENNRNVINTFVPKLSDLDQDSKFVINLENVPSLSAFWGKPVSIGFINQSQANSMYEIIEFKTPTTIVDGFTNSISTYNFNTDKYEKVSNILPAAFVGPGRLTKNSFTGKLFYVTQTGFVKLYEPKPIITYTVTFNLNGGSGTVPPREVVNGYKVGPLPTPTRSGYDFNGWFTEESGGVQISENQIITDDVTYYAQWSEIVVHRILITEDDDRLILENGNNYIGV